MITMINNKLLKLYRYIIIIKINAWRIGNFRTEACKKRVLSRRSKETGSQSFLQQKEICRSE